MPIDFVLFEKPEDFDEDMDYVEIEEEIEKKRAAITQGTPLNDTTFAEWKEKRVQRLAEEAAIAEEEAEKKIGLTGKQIFKRGLQKGGTNEADYEDAVEEDLNLYMKQYK